MMKILKTVDRELTEEEIQSMQKFRSYTDGVSFACIGQRVMVIIPDETSHDVEVLKEQALQYMDEAISTHPDFTVYEMNDGHVLLSLDSGVFAFSEEPCRSGMAVNFALREECLEAAEKGEIIAIAYEED